MGTTSKTHKARKTGGKPRGASTKRQPADAPVIPPADGAIAIIPAAPSTLTEKPSKGEERATDTTGPPQEAEPQRQSWWRPADSKMRKSFEKIMVMRAAGHEDKEIAKRLKTTEHNVRQTVYIAKKNGWADDDGEPIDLEAELAFNIDRKIVRNIGAALDGGMTNWQTHEMTIAAAKGRGVFKSEKVDGAAALPSTMVAIQVIMPAVGASDQLPQIADDQMGGVPNYLEGEVESV